LFHELLGGFLGVKAIEWFSLRLVIRRKV
jgi:hypothetical protein